MTYKGVTIETRCHELLGISGWDCEFDLLIDEGDSTVVTHYALPETFGSEEEAISSAISAAMKVIDEKHS